MAQKEIDLRSINTIRTLAMDAVQKAKSGHPGMPMGAAAMAYTLWMRHLRHNPANPRWVGRDRFVLSAGHGSMLLYALLHLTGYAISLEDLKSFRQLHSKTPGHPERDPDSGVEMTTGPLGQGFATGVGMAIGQKFLGERFNRPGYPVLDYRIFAIVSDGDLMEGVSSEAASLAGHLGLDNLVYLYDDNRISIDGSTELAFTENTAKRFEAFGWHVQSVADGNSIASIDTALKSALKTKGKPHLIRIRTHIGFGSPNKQDRAESHGSPLGEEEVRLTKQNLDWDPALQFYIPDDVLEHMRSSLDRGKEWEKEWNGMWSGYEREHAELAAELAHTLREDWGEEWKKALPVFDAASGAIATREASGRVLGALSSHLPTLIGGSADLTPSNNTRTHNAVDFQAEAREGRYLRFGVREHAMAAALNGLALTGGLIPYGGTFLVFSDYMRPAVRLAALMGVRPIYIFTHDSIGLGEDGPTHQPVEQLAALRAIPNITVIRPADANEVAVAWQFAIEHRTGPVALILTRQKVSFIDRSKYLGADNLAFGAYTLAQTSEHPELILIGSGSEVQLVIGAYEKLAAEGTSVRVVNMASWELFERQSPEFRESVLPSSVRKRLAVEAGSPLGWHRYVGSEGIVIGMTGFGASARAETLLQTFGFTVDNVLQHARRLLKS